MTTNPFPKGRTPGAKSFSTLFFCKNKGWRYSSVAQQLHIILEALGLIPSIEKFLKN
jgi:hypothetical protein